MAGLRHRRACGHRGPTPGHDAPSLTAEHRAAAQATLPTPRPEEQVPAAPRPGSPADGTLQPGPGDAGEGRAGRLRPATPAPAAPRVAAGRAAVVPGRRRTGRGPRAAEVAVLGQPPGASLLGLDSCCRKREEPEGVGGTGRDSPPAGPQRWGCGNGHAHPEALQVHPGGQAGSAPASGRWTSQSLCDTDEVLETVQENVASSWEADTGQGCRALRTPRESPCLKGTSRLGPRQASAPTRALFLGGAPRSEPWREASVHVQRGRRERRCVPWLCFSLENLFLGPGVCPAGVRQSTRLVGAGCGGWTLREAWAGPCREAGHRKQDRDQQDKDAPAGSPLISVLLISSKSPDFRHVLGVSNRPRDDAHVVGLTQHLHP